MKKKFFRWLGFLVLPVLCTGCQLMPEEETFQDAPVLYSYEIKEYPQESVMRGDLVLSMAVNCTYMAANQEQLGFEVSGEYIDQIYVSKGQQVQTGQLLAELQYGDLKEAITAAEYEYKVLKLKQEHILENQSLDQLQEDSDTVAKRYEAQLQEVADEIYIAELQLEKLKEDLQQRQIYAGMDGTVIEVKNVRDGERSTSGETVITIADIDTNVFLVQSEDAQYFTPGTQTTVQCGKTTYEVEVVEAAQLGIAELSQENEDAAYLRLTQPDLTLEDGKKGKTEVVLEKRSDVLYVPKGTVKKADGKELVYTLDENGLRVMQHVETGLRTEEYIEIISGLEEGDTVIIG